VSLLELCQWLQDSPLGVSISASGYAYPLIEGSHVMGLALPIGTVMWFDLRLMGIVMRRDSVTNVFNAVRPWMSAGFAVMLVSGALLFTARAADAYLSTYFRVKVGLLVLGALNVILFHATIDRDRARWDTAERPPLRARTAGALSLALWFGIIAAGRIMAYNL
jgi:hypothetical protein